MAEWVAALAAVVSVLGAAFAWWRANLSRSSKESAEAAEAAIRERLTAIREQAEAMRRLAEVAEGPPLVIEKCGGPTWILWNTFRRSVTVTDILNLHQIAIQRNLSTPFTLHHGQGHDFLAATAHGYPLPSALTVRVEAGLT